MRRLQPRRLNVGARNPFGIQRVGQQTTEFTPNIPPPPGAVSPDASFSPMGPFTPAGSPIGPLGPGFNPMAPVCHPGTQKLVSETVTIAAGATVTLELSTPGVFCPRQLLMQADGASDEVFVESIKVGLRDQIITGRIPIEFFDVDNHCCLFMLLDCLCSPSVPLEVTVTNESMAPQDINVTAIGSYVDGCVQTGPLPPSQTKLAGFSVDIPPGDTATVEFTTPGRFCPERLMLFGDVTLTTRITSIKVGTEDQLIGGPVPANLFSLDNECCIITCFKCLCMPGYPMVIEFENTDGMAEADVHGVLVGSYADAC